MSTTQQTVSVLIAAHAAGEWLRESVESALDQTLPTGWRLELIVGIDGCPATERLARALDRSRVTTIVLPENHGTYVTFNTLLLYATGTRILRFDADDVMLPGYLERQVESTEEADLSMTWSIYTDSELEPTSYVMAHEFYHPANGECRRGSEGQIAMRREVLDTLGGYRPWRCSADTDFLFRAAAHGFRIAVVEEFLYLRRTHEGSLTVRPDTAFKSPLRERYEAFMASHRPIYEVNPATRCVQPKTACSHARL